MALVTSKYLLKKAQKGKYAVGAFNFVNMEMFQGIVNAAVSQKSPALLQTTEGAINYAGVSTLRNIARSVDELKIPFALHLDHGKHIDTIKSCLKVGYTSVMMDASDKSFNDNIKLTKKAAILAHKHGASIEGEIGVLAGVEDDVSAEKSIYTDPEQAKEFVLKTGVDALAIAIGTSHGAYKFKTEAKLEINILKEIRKKVNIPLVLHGASGVPRDIVKLAEKYGEKLNHSKGVPDSEIKKAVREGICKINIDTDLRLSAVAAIRETFSKHPENFDMRKIMGPARELIQKTVEQKMKLFGSVGKA